MVLHSSDGGMLSVRVAVGVVMVVVMVLRMGTVALQHRAWGNDGVEGDPTFSKRV